MLCFPNTGTNGCATAFKETLSQATGSAARRSERAPSGGKAATSTSTRSPALCKHTVNLRSRPHGHRAFRSRLRGAARGTTCAARHGEAPPGRQVGRAAAAPARRRGDQNRPRGAGPGRPRPAPRDDSQMQQPGLTQPARGRAARARGAGAGAGDARGGERSGGGAAGPRRPPARTAPHAPGHAARRHLVRPPSPRRPAPPARGLTVFVK